MQRDCHHLLLPIWIIPLLEILLQGDNPIAGLVIDLIVDLFQLPGKLIHDRYDPSGFQIQILMQLGRIGFEGDS
jgi:hypothetical protein